MLRCCLSTAALLLVQAATTTAQESPLDAIDPKRVPASARPRGLPAEVVAVLGDRGGRYDCLAFRPDGKQLAVSGPDGIVTLWDLPTLRGTIAARLKFVTVLTYSPSGKVLAVGDAQGTIRWFNLTTSRPSLFATVKAHAGQAVWALTYAPDGKSVASGGADRAVRLWDTTKSPPTMVASLPGHGDTVKAVAFAPDGQSLVTAGGEDKSVRLWEVGSGKPKLAATATLPVGVPGVAMSPDGVQVAAACGDGAVRLFTVGEKLTEKAVLRNPGRQAAVVFAPDGKSVAGLLQVDATEDRVVVWDAAGTKRHECKYGDKILALAFAPDGRHLALVNEANVYLVRLPK